MAKVTRKNILIPEGRSCHKNAHVQYESSSAQCSKVKSKVQVFKLQGQGHSVKNNGTHKE